MSHELIMLSVSKGLRPNSSGFCTVARNRDIPVELEAVLERPPRYRHLFPPESLDAPFNAIACAHRIVTCDDTSWHILSRTCDAGIDFRQRSNRLVHQLAILPEEATIEGPAWVLAQPGVFFKSWVGPSLEFVRGRPLPTRYVSANAWEIAREEQDLPPLVGTSRCPSWEKVSGDAGWAGVLAETVYTGQKAVLVFPKGFNLLPLIQEAVALLPVEDRWKATFSTFFVPEPESGAADPAAIAESESILWKGVVHSTPEEQALAHRRGILLIDLTRPAGLVPEGAFADFARGGSSPGSPNAAIFQSIEDIDSVPEPPPLPLPNSSQPVDDVQGQDASSETREENASDPARATEKQGIAPEGIFGDLSDEGAPDPLLSPTDAGATGGSPEIAAGDSAQNTTPHGTPSHHHDNPSSPVVAPPIIVPQSIETRASRQGKGTLDTLLGMRSRTFFYTAYAAAFGIILLLTFLLLDQQWKWGWATAVKQAFSGKTAAPSQPPPAKNKGNSGDKSNAKEKTDPKEKADKSKETSTSDAAQAIPRNATPQATPQSTPQSTPVDDSAAQAERIDPDQTQSSESSQNMPAASNGQGDQESSRPGLLELAVAKEKEAELRREWREKRITLQAEQEPILEKVLGEWTPPDSVSLAIPTLSDENPGEIVKPRLVRIKEFAPLWKAGAALSVEIVPYLPSGDFRAFCRECDPVESRALLESMSEAASGNKPGEKSQGESSPPPKDGLEPTEPYRWVIGIRPENDDVPDAPENSGTETPLCLLSLDEQGLNFEWLPDAVEPRYFQEAGRIPFSMLVLNPFSPSDAAENSDEKQSGNEDDVPDADKAEESALDGTEKEPEKPKRIFVPLFAPVALEPISVASVLQGNPVERPVVFAESPWTDVFEGITDRAAGKNDEIPAEPSTNNPWERIRLDAATEPESVKGFREARIDDTERKPAMLNLDLYSDSIWDRGRNNLAATRLLVVLRNGNLLVESKHAEQLTLLNDGIKRVEDEIKEKKDVLDKEQKKLALAGGKADPGSVERVKDLRAETDRFSRESGELRLNMQTMAQNLPRVRNVIIRLESLRLHVAVELVPPAPGLPPLPLMSTRPKE